MAGHPPVPRSGRGVPEALAVVSRTRRVWARSHAGSRPQTNRETGSLRAAFHASKTQHGREGGRSRVLVCDWAFGTAFDVSPHLDGATGCACDMRAAIRTSLENNGFGSRQHVILHRGQRRFMLPFLQDVSLPRMRWPPVSRFGVDGSRGTASPAPFRIEIEAFKRLSQNTFFLADRRAKYLREKGVRLRFCTRISKLLSAALVPTLDHGRGGAVS